MMSNIYTPTAIALLLIAVIGGAGMALNNIAPAGEVMNILLQWGAGGALLLALVGVIWWWWRTTAKVGLSHRLPLRVKQEFGATLVIGIRVIVLLALVDAGVKLGGLLVHLISAERTELPASITLAGSDLLLALLLCGLLGEEGSDGTKG